MKVAISSLRKIEDQNWLDFVRCCSDVWLSAECTNPFEISGTCSPSGSEFVRISGRLSYTNSASMCLRTGGSVVQVSGYVTNIHR